MPLALEWRFAAIEVPNGGSFKSAQTQKGALATMYDPPFPPVGFFQPWFFYMIFDMSDAQAMFNVLRSGSSGTRQITGSAASMSWISRPRAD